ncbi:MAG: flap endonuclease [Bacteroidetes bacterium]|nr:flap endonuclease [Bacteroidota bacterium]
MPKKIHLVDGTYELFRNYYGAPPKKSPDGREVGATLSLLRSLLVLLNSGATHVACAFDTVIESFRNTLYEGYKTGEGMDPDLFSQFTLAEEAVSALGLTVWSMIDFEADDGIASGVAKFSKNKSVEQIVICSPDKDLAQMVTGKRVVCWDRRRDIVLDEDGVVEKFGVKPESIPDYLGLVGDAADGYPGIPGWGSKSASVVLAKFKHIESIPDDPSKWKLKVRGADRLAQNLSQQRKEAMLYRKLATLRVDVPIKETVGDLEWKGAHERLKHICQECGDDALPSRISTWRKD